MPESPWDNGVDAEPLETSSAQSPGYLARLKMAASDSFETAKRAPATFDEAVAVLRGERDVKPDFERATSTVSAASRAIFFFQYFSGPKEPVSCGCPMFHHMPYTCTPFRTCPYFLFRLIAPNFTREKKKQAFMSMFLLCATQAFAGGCIHGWMRSASLAARYPRHQRGIVRVRSGAGKGLSFAMFALIFEG